MSATEGDVRRMLADHTDAESVQYIVDTIEAESPADVSESFLKDIISPFMEGRESALHAMDELITLLCQSRVTQGSLAVPDGAPESHSTASDNSGRSEDEAEEDKHIKGKPRKRSPRAKPDNKKKSAPPTAAPATGGVAGIDTGIQIYARQSRFHTELTDNRGGDIEVDLKDVTIEFYGKELLANAKIKLHKGRKYCFIGRNGCGKTTLLKQMAQQTIPGWPRSVVTLMVEQEYVGSQYKSALDYVMEADRDLNALWRERDVLEPAMQNHGLAEVVLAAQKVYKLERELEEIVAFTDKTSGTRGWQGRQTQVDTEAQLAHARDELVRVRAVNAEGGPSNSDAITTITTAHAELEERLKAAGAQEALSRAKKILTGLGLTVDMMTMPSSLMSGGWRMRTALGAALFAEPHLLLLDEPSNHLDLTALLWLEEYILENMHDATIICITHDRALIDKIADEIIWLRKGKLTYHPGNYSKFMREQEELKLHNDRTQEQIDKDKAKYESQIQKMQKSARESGNDKALKQAASRRKKIETRSGVEKNAKGHRFKLNRDLAGYHLTFREGVDHEVAEAPVTLKLQVAEPLGYYGPVLQMEGVNCGYKGLSKPIVRNVTLDVPLNARIGIVGENGSGKSTLFATLMGTLDPVNKTVILRHARLQIGYFAQHQITDLEDDKSAIEHIIEKFPEMNEKTVRSHLGRFGINGKLPTNPMQTLSGGQRVRVALATAFIRPPHILILDEVTNHLDIETIQALTKALQEYKGGILFTSHDRQFVTDIAEVIYVVKDGRFAKIEKYDQYVRMLAPK